MKQKKLKYVHFIDDPSLQRVAKRLHERMRGNRVGRGAGGGMSVERIYDQLVEGVHGTGHWLLSKKGTPPKFLEARPDWPQQCCNCEQAWMSEEGQQCEHLWKVNKHGVRVYPMIEKPMCCEKFEFRKPVGGVQKKSKQGDNTMKKVASIIALMCIGLSIAGCTNINTPLDPYVDGKVFYEPPAVVTLPDGTTITNDVSGATAPVTVIEALAVAIAKEKLSDKWDIYDIQVVEQNGVRMTRIVTKYGTFTVDLLPDEPISADDKVVVNLDDEDNPLGISIVGDGWIPGTDKTKATFNATD
jgi:hypothetical protein